MRRVYRTCLAGPQNNLTLSRKNRCFRDLGTFEQGTYRDQLQVLLRTAYERVGVTAVPTMLIGRQRLEGLHPAEVIRQVIEGELQGETETPR